MRIIHIAYPRINSTDAQQWLDSIGFFTGILKEQAHELEVKSVHCLNVNTVLVRDGVEYHFIKRNVWQTLFPFGLHAYIKKLSPDAVIVHGLHFGWQILWLRFQLGSRCKIFVQHHAERPKRFPKNIIQGLADKYIHGYFFAARELAISWVEARQIKAMNKVHVVAAGSSTFHSIDKDYSRNNLGLPLNELIYIWVGALDRNKDPLTLLKAFKLFSENHERVHLYVIFNKGELEKELREMNSASSSITLVDSVEHSNLLNWYNSADFIISTSHYESSGFAVCEGMSCGCIPILTSIPSFKQFTNNGELGLLFPAGNMEKLYKALIMSLGMSLHEQREMTLDQFTKNLSFTAIANKMSSVIQG